VISHLTTPTSRPIPRDPPVTIATLPASWSLWSPILPNMFELPSSILGWWRW